MAELGGNRWRHLSRSLFANRKTVIGSICFAASALVISIICIVFVFQFTGWQSALMVFSVTIVTTLAELLSFKGYDNLSVPLSALLVLVLFCLNLLRQKEKALYKSSLSPASGK